jgi:hypothetical protein
MTSKEWEENTNIESFFLYKKKQGEQIFQQDDPVRHEAIFKNVEKRTPRALSFGFKGTLEALQYKNYLDIDKMKS